MRVGPTLERILREYPNDVQIVWKHLPLRMHPEAPEAHAAAEAAHRQGKFWEMHDLIFANQDALRREKYVEHATALGLDVERFVADMDSPDVRARVSEDSRRAANLKVTSTPSFFVNGRFLPGARPFEEFRAFIDEELERR